MPRLFVEQCEVNSPVIDKVPQKKGYLFMDAPGGIEKTFIFNLVLAKMRKQERIALVMPFSCIAATLLPGGCTTHCTTQTSGWSCHEWWACM